MGTFWRYFFGKTMLPVVDGRALNALVGVIAISFASVEGYLTDSSIDSISASFHVTGLPKTFFIGFLFAIAAILIAHNGKSRFEKWSTKVAAIAAIGIVLAPCTCGMEGEKYGTLHALSAGVMFGILAVHCILYCVRAWGKFNRRKRGDDRPDNKPWSALARFWIYIACAVSIVLAMGLVAYDLQTDDSLSKIKSDFIFWMEFVGLVAFGVSWLTASRVLFASKGERYIPFRKYNPPDD